MVGWSMVFSATFNNILSDIVAVSFIGGGKRSTRRKPPIVMVDNITNHKVFKIAETEEKLNG